MSFKLKEPVELSKVLGLRLVGLSTSFAIVELNGESSKYDYGRLIRKNLKNIREISKQINLLALESMKAIFSIIIRDAIRLKIEGKRDFPPEYINYLILLTMCTPKSYTHEIDRLDFQKVFGEDLKDKTGGEALKAAGGVNYITHQNSSSWESRMERWDKEDLRAGMDYWK